MFLAWMMVGHDCAASRHACANGLASYHANPTTRHTQYAKAVDIFANKGHSKESRSQAEGALHGEIRRTLKGEFPDAHPLAPAMCSDKVLRKG